MKKLLALLLAAMLLVPAFAMADNVVRIGVFEPSTGDNGAGGKQEILGIEYANSLAPTVTIGGEEYTVELVIEDNQSLTDKAISAAQSLVSKDVSVVLGSYGSGVSMAGGDVFAEAGVPAIGVSCTNPNVTLLCDYYWRICFLDPFQGTALANYAFKALNATTAYCLGELGNDYDQGLINYFREAYEALGGTVIVDAFPTNNADFTSYLTNAEMYGAEVLFCPVSIAYSTLIIQQAASMNLAFPVLGGDTLDSNVVVAAAVGTNIDLTVTTFYQEGANPAFDEGFKAWLNSDATAMANNGGNDMISAVSVMGYDGYYMALAALQAAGTTDPAKVMAVLPTIELDGASGHIVFDENGDAVRNSAFVKKANTATGDWEFVTEQTVE